MIDVDKLLVDAEALYDNGKFAQVTAMLPDDVLKENNDPDLYFLSAKAHFSLLSKEKALEHINRSIELREDDAYFYDLRARILAQMNEHDKAIDDYGRSIELEKDNHAFYYNRGISWIAKKEYDKAITDCNKAIELKNDYFIAYNNRGVAWSNKQEYDRAILDFDKAIELKPDYALAYGNRGDAWFSKKDFDRAIIDFTKSVEFKDDPKIYSKRGDAWQEKKEFDKAIADYDKSIELDGENADSYVTHGNTLYYKEDYKKALEDYIKAIEKNNKYVEAYYNCGLALVALNDFEPALEYINKGIKVDVNDLAAYELRGHIYEKLDKNKDALEDYNFVLKKNPADVDVGYRRDALLAKLGVHVKFDSAKADGTLYQIVNAVNEIEDEDDKLELIKYYKLEIEPLINQVREHSAKIDDEFWRDATGKVQPKLLAHYSNLKVMDLLVTGEKGKLRYSNAVFMNDPEEGKILIDYLDFLEEHGKEKREIKEAFYNIQKEERTNFYLGAFLPVKDFHEDELLMWRTYGKDENSNEAAGCCLVIDAGFFDTADAKFIAMGIDRDKKPAEISHPLYKVIYFNKRKGKIEGDHNDLITQKLGKLKDALKALLKRRTKKGSKRNKAIERVLYHSLSELRYFFKSADYSYENELRVIQFATHDDIVEIDLKSTLLPRRMYIESSKELRPHLRKIILGPKVLHPERWMYLEELMKRKGHKIEMAYSICHFQ